VEEHDQRNIFPALGAGPLLPFKFVPVPLD